MTKVAQKIVFLPFRLDLENERLERDGEDVALRPKALAVLSHLARRPGRLVSKQDLLRAVWPGTHVTDSVVKVCVREIREALGDDPKAPRFLETVPRRGYRFLGSGERPARRRPGRSHGSPMVGRDEALLRLSELLVGARRGHRQLVLVTGEPGIGKTTLVNALLGSLAGMGDVRTAVGQCQELFGSGEAYLPVLETLDRLCEGSPEMVELLRRQAPSWLLQLPWRLDGEELEELRRRTAGVSPTRMLREMVEALQTLAGEAAVVLVLEDLHWSDSSTLDLVSALVRRPEPARLMILATIRSTELEGPLKTLLHDLQLHGLCHELALEPLEPAEVEDYLRCRLPEPAPPDLAALLHRRTDGHPLFVSHLVDYVLESADASAERLREALENRRAGLPHSLRQVIEAVIDRASAEERRFLEQASVAGISFSAAAAAGEDVARTEELCERLLGRFLRAAGTAEWPDGTVSGRYEFLHALYQEVLYRRLPESARIRAHQRLGARVERAFGERTAEVAGELAMHCERGRDLQRAVRFRGEAAKTALRRHAYREAIEHLQRGLELLQRLPEDGQRHRRELTLRTLLGPALMTTRGFTAPEAHHNYERAEELCGEITETPELLPVMWGRWIFHWMRAEHRTAHEIGLQSLALAETAGASAAQQLIAHRMLGGTLYYTGELAGAQEHLKRGLAIYEARGRGSSEALGTTADSGVFCRCFRALVLWLRGFPDAALRDAEAARELGIALSHPFSHTMACGFLAAVHMLRGDWDAAWDSLEETETIAREEGFPLWLAAATVRQGRVLAERGEAEEGIARLRQGMEAWHRTGAELWRPLNLLYLAESYRRAGRPRRALEEVRTALAFVAEHDERWCHAELLRLEGELLLASGGEAARAEAEHLLHRALEVARRQGARAWELRAANSLAHLGRCRGERTFDKKLLAELCAGFQEGHDTADLAAARGLLFGSA